MITIANFSFHKHFQNGNTAEEIPGLANYSFFLSRTMRLSTTTKDCAVLRHCMVSEFCQITTVVSGCLIFKQHFAVLENKCPSTKTSGTLYMVSV